MSPYPILAPGAITGLGTQPHSRAHRASRLVQARAPVLVTGGRRMLAAS